MKTNKQRNKKNNRKTSRNNQPAACTTVVSVKAFSHPRTHYYQNRNPYTKLFNVRLSCRLSAKSSTNSLNFVNPQNLAR